MNILIRGLLEGFKAFVDLLKLLPHLFSALVGFFRGLLRAIRCCFHRPDRRSCCVHVPPTSYKRPDPMLYSQTWLMSQGLSVTWDNPDIQLYDAHGNHVSPWGLTPDQDYRVVVRVWNNSYDAPAALLPVDLSFLSFGVGAKSTWIGKTYTNLGVKGSAHCPAYADFLWHAPKMPGHYCLQALLVWADDANPDNNLGQKNTQVGSLHSPAMFSFVVHNEASVPRRFELEPDMYRLPDLEPCGDQSESASLVVTKGVAPSRLAESHLRWARALRAQSYGMFTVSDAWRVTIDPASFDLAPDATRTVDVSIEPTAGAFTGRQAFNIHGFASPPDGPRLLIGGVTLYVEGN